MRITGTDVTHSREFGTLYLDLGKIYLDLIKLYLDYDPCNNVEKSI